MSEYIAVVVDLPTAPRIKDRDIPDLDTKLSILDILMEQDFRLLGKGPNGCDRYIFPTLLVFKRNILGAVGDVFCTEQELRDALAIENGQLITFGQGLDDGNA